jgi:hypothetical protein
VYFARDGEELVILFCGGTKARQQSDINKAKEYWSDYKKRKKQKKKEDEAKAKGRQQKTRRKM